MGHHEREKTFTALVQIDKFFLTGENFHSRRPENHENYCL